MVQRGLCAHIRLLSRRGASVGNDLPRHNGRTCFVARFDAPFLGPVRICDDQHAAGLVIHRVQVFDPVIPIVEPYLPPDSRCQDVCGDPHSVLRALHTAPIAMGYVRVSRGWLRLVLLASLRLAFLVSHTR